jgi:uncharacterized protein
VIVPDVNLLLYAAVDGFPLHDRARQWWDAQLSGADEVGLTSPAVFGFLRLVTNPRVLAPAMEAVAATGTVRQWLGQPNVRMLSPGRRHLDIALGLIEGLGTAANLTSDVQLAAYAMEHDAELCSNDSDFARFEGLRWTNPLGA